MPSLSDLAKRVVTGVEVEAYSIGAGDYQIGRRLSRPRPGVSEDGERFTRDSSIGSEYNSRPFETVRESLFLLKSGLRKYLRSLYRSHQPLRDHVVPLLVGGWTNRFAGTHIHVSIAGQRLTQDRAADLSHHIHDHIPFLIAIGANSPVWDHRLTTQASNRFLRGSETYFLPSPPGELHLPGDDVHHEMVYNPARKRKPATLEIRVLDSNLPEFIVAALCVIKAVSLRWLSGGEAGDHLRHSNYLWSRLDAGHRGMRCRLQWQGRSVTAGQYLDKFLWEYRREIEEIDPPEEILEVFKLLKKGFNGARIIRDAAAFSRREHPQTWQRRFARRYYEGLELLLSGNTLRDFAETMKVQLPDTSNVWLGRRGAQVYA